MSDRLTLSERFSASRSSRRPASVTAQRMEERRKASREESRMKQRRAAVESSNKNKSSGSINLDSVVFDGSASAGSRSSRRKPVVVLAPQAKKTRAKRNAPSDKGLKQIRVVFGGPVREAPGVARRRQNAQRRKATQKRTRAPRVTTQQLDSSLDAYMRG